MYKYPDVTCTNSRVYTVTPKAELENTNFSVGMKGCIGVRVSVEIIDQKQSLDFFYYWQENMPFKRIP